MVFAHCRRRNISEVATGEIGRIGLATLVEDESEINWEVDPNAKHIGLHGGAKADGSIEIGDP
uniref:Uncharacterized protein n=2 Tax=Oryza sativa subsp. japonica TaxID=39947 RepID=Q8LM50_ORYSJ|nr:Hypothetical protein [Oryza sativa Japonica Group]AAP53197.1 hypothetical protein LOC_Os10g20850 [Oryza sativa Japonica Group]